MTSSPVPGWGDDSRPPWEPGQADPDTADDVHELLAAIPAHQRPAAAALLDLPDDYPVPLPGHSLVEVPAGRLFVMMCSGRLPTDQVWRYLRAHRLVRPGLGGAT